MFGFIWLTMSIILLIICYFEAKGASKVNKNIILGVMLPPLEVKNAEVLKITDNFMKQCVKLYIIEFILCIPCVFFRNVYQFIYWLVWFFTAYYFHYRLICKNNNKLKELKRKNNWLLPNKHILNIDTEVTRISNKMPISSWWFVIAFTIGLAPIVIELIIKSGYKTSLLISVGTSIITNVLFMLLFKIYALGRTVVYSDDTKVNIACNKVQKRTWSIIYVVSAIILSAINTLIYTATVIANFIVNTLVIIMLIAPLLLIVAIIWGRNHIVKVQNSLISNSSKAVYVDSDEYWINGIFYKNPYDNRVSVEPRIGYKAVYNLATKKGRIIEYGSWIFAAVVLIGVVTMMLIIETVKYDVSITNDRVEINAPFYGVDVLKDNIEEVSLVDKIKVTLRTNGIGAEEYSIGEFKVEGYGKCRLYVVDDVSPYICIKTNENYIFINEDTKAETNETYERILDLINK